MTDSPEDIAAWFSAKPTAAPAQQPTASAKEIQDWFKSPTTPAQKPASVAAAPSDPNDISGYVDAASSFGRGMAKGVIGIPGFVGDVANLVGAGGDILRKKGVLPEIPKDSFFARKAPGSREMIDAAAKYVPALQEKSTTEAGRYAETVGELTPAAGKKFLQYALAPGLATRYAEHKAEQGELPAWAPTVAGIGTTILAGRPSVQRATQSVAELPAKGVRKALGITPGFDMSGNLSPSALSAIKEAGIDAGDVSAITPRLKQAFAEKGVSPAVVREAAAGEFNVPLSRGEAIADPNAIWRESKLPTDGSFGEFKGKQAEAVGKARESLIGSGYTNPTDAFADVLSGVRTAAADAKEATKNAYESAYAMPGFFDIKAARTTPAAVKQAMLDAGYVVDREMTPTAAKALDIIEKDLGQTGLWNNLGGNPDPAKIVGINMRGVEQVRKKLSNLRGDTLKPTDGRALKSVLENFDNHVEQMMLDGMFSGHPDALRAMQEARGLHAKYMSTFGKKSGDQASRIVAEIVKPDSTISPTSLANYFLNNGALNGQIGTKSVSVPLYERLERALGAGSDEMETIRSALKLKLLTPTEMQNKTPARQAQDVAKRINQFLNANGRPLAQRAFTPEELATFRRYAVTLQNATRKGAEDLKARNSTWLNDLAWKAAEAAGVGAAVGTHGMSGFLTTLLVPLVNQFKGSLDALGAKKSALEAASGAPRVAPNVSPPSMTRLLYMGDTLSNRDQRASGGRVMHKARKLDAEASRTLKALGGALNPIMDMPDEAVANALRIAKHQ